MKLFWFFICCLVFSSCFQPEALPDPLEEEVVTGYDASIEVQVVVCDSIANQSCVSTYPGAGASVELYATYEDLEYRDPLVQSGVVGSSGTLQFSGLEGGKRYYLLTTYSGESEESSETTPSNGIAKHEVLLFPN